MNTKMTPDQTRERMTYLIGQGRITETTPPAEIRRLVDAVTDAEMALARAGGGL